MCDRTIPPERGFEVVRLTGSAIVDIPSVESAHFCDELKIAIECGINIELRSSEHHVPIIALCKRIGPDSFTESNDWNVMFTRAELDIDATFNSNLKFVAKVRGLYAWDIYDSGPGEPNYFETPFRGDCAIAQSPLKGVSK